MFHLQVTVRNIEYSLAKSSLNIRKLKSTHRMTHLETTFSQRFDILEIYKNS